MIGIAFHLTMCLAFGALVLLGCSFVVAAFYLAVSEQTYDEWLISRTSAADADRKSD